MHGASVGASHAFEPFVHNWDCISCSTNSMLVSNVGTWRKDLSLDNPWWVNALPDSHAAGVIGPSTQAIRTNETRPIPSAAMAMRSANIAAAANRKRRRYSASLLADPTG